MEKDGKTISYADVRGEWEQRKISIVGVVKNFIGQLKVGQELTKVSIPSIFLRPYSLLEEFGSRNLAHFPILFNLSSQTNPVDRMITVLTWICSATREEDFNHKPYNPILGESHICKQETEGSTTYFLAEQVSHHPPMTAFLLENPDHKIRIQGNYAFGIRFATNSLTIATEGHAEIRFGDETYILEKAMPDMAVKNIILPGRKYVVWVGKIRIVCPSTKLSAELTWDFRDYQSVIDGFIYKDYETNHLAPLPATIKTGSHQPSPAGTPSKSKRHSPRGSTSSSSSQTPTSSTNLSEASPSSKPIILLRGKAGGELFIRDLVDDVPHALQRLRTEKERDDDRKKGEEKQEKQKQQKAQEEQQQKEKEKQQQEGYGSWMWKGLVTATSYVNPAAYYVTEDKTEEQKYDVLVVNFAERKLLIPDYPPLESLPPNSSMIIWAPLAKEIIAGDFEKADEVKKKIEDDQRTKRHVHTEAQTLHQTKHFHESEDVPKYFVIKPDYANKLAECFSNPLL
jgi:hypothetical protein